MYSVINCEKASPPTTAMPSGRRVSEPMPVASATGSVPTSAATVVIMIGRKRTCAAWMIASAGAICSLCSASTREVHHHDRVLLHDADQQDDADEGEDAQLDVEEVEREQRAERGERQARRES